MESQGSVLGLYGLGNIGQSAAVFLGPLVAAAYGFRAVYWGMSVILLVWAAVFAVYGRNATETVRPKGVSEMIGQAVPELLSHVGR
jgi:MFS transporter, NNP family, nitrate/nitrite transporter